MTDKNCTFCHWYDWEKRSCKHDGTFTRIREDMQGIVEDAPIREAVEEGFSDTPFNRLKMNLESKLSKKQAQRIMQEFYNELEEIKTDWTDEITSEVITTIVNHCDGERESAVEINEPKDFYCKHFV